MLSSHHYTASIRRRDEVVQKSTVASGECDSSSDWNDAFVASLAVYHIII